MSRGIVVFVTFLFAGALAADAVAQRRPADRKTRERSETWRPPPPDDPPPPPPPFDPGKPASDPGPPGALEPNPHGPGGGLGSSGLVILDTGRTLQGLIGPDPLDCDLTQLDPGSPGSPGDAPEILHFLECQPSTTLVLGTRALAACTTAVPYDCANETAWFSDATLMSTSPTCNEAQTLPLEQDDDGVELAGCQDLGTGQFRVWLRLNWTASGAWPAAAPTADLFLGAVDASQCQPRFASWRYVASPDGTSSCRWPETVDLDTQTTVVVQATIADLEAFGSIPAWYGGWPRDFLREGETESFHLVIEAGVGPNDFEAVLRVAADGSVVDNLTCGAAPPPEDECEDDF